MADQLPKPETQKQRWVKYGANVVLVSIVVIALAVIATYLAQRTNRRVDTTHAGLYSLKPQTVNIIKENKGPVKLVSLYTAPDRELNRNEVDYATTVSDLLDEYKRKGKNIEVDVIDPVKQGSKVDALVEEAIQKYGGELKPYKDVVAAHEAAYAEIQKLAEAEAAKIAGLPTKDVQTDASTELVVPALNTPQAMPETLRRSRETIKRRLNLKPPDYKAAVTSIESATDEISQQAAKIKEILTAAKDNPKVPEPIRQYIASSGPAFDAIKKAADDLLAKTKNLGSTQKLDDLRQKLREQNAILVLGPNDLRSLSFEQVWKQNDDEIRSLASNAGAEIRPRFAGEQQITTAILSLTTEKKPKVALVRPGGPPLADAGFPPFQPSGPFSRIAERLRDYNFEVVEKDLSGMWAMQAQMRQQPAAPEPTDEEIKDAVWIVLSMPQQQQDPRMGGMQQSIAPKVAEHLKAGGSAMVLFLPNADNMADALKDWGVSVDTSQLIVHELVPSSGAPSGDFIEDAQRTPYIFVTNKYGDHPLTKPLQSLDSLLLPMLPVKTDAAAKGVKVTPLIPIPSTPQSWAETEVDRALQNEPIAFDPKTDTAGPLFAGAAVEKSDGKGRLVVLGSMQFMTNQMINLPDPDLLRRGVLVSRFPGNAELVANSVFWLANMETLIAISPNAMEVSRIAPMSDAAQAGWHYGVLLIGIPALVIAAGLMVYFARRD